MSGEWDEEEEGGVVGCLRSDRTEICLGSTDVDVGRDVLPGATKTQVN